ncbi:MAG: Maf family protein [Bdellovibrionota bacterium]|jgi:septum formation protein|nr:Maf family protein [Bdellovibrionota bacterium]
MEKFDLVLASQSPRRRELLGWIDIPFDIHPSSVEEVTQETEPTAFAIDLAALKGRDIWKELEEGPKNALIVSSDTIVELNGKIYGKPGSKEEARQMLLELSNQWHQVVTAVFLKGKVAGEVREHSFAVKTKVKFSSIGEDIMEPYLKSEESMDKAGAYGIQGKGLVFVEAIEGSYSNVVGFPLVEFLNELKVFIGLGKDAENWREYFSC